MPFPTRRRSPDRPPAALSATDPNPPRGPFGGLASVAATAGGPGFAPPHHPCCVASKGRGASPVHRYAALAQPGADSILRSPDAQERRSRLCGEAPERRASAAPFASDGQPLASLCPSTSEHATATLGGHASHEAMLALASALLGLIGPLHGSVPVPRSSPSAMRGPDTQTAGLSPASTRSVKRLAHFALPAILPMLHGGCQTSAGAPPRRESLPADSRGCYIGRTPRHGPVFEVSARRSRTHPNPRREAARPPENVC